MSKLCLTPSVRRIVHSGIQIATVLPAILAVRFILLSTEVSADDAEDCDIAEAVVRTEPSRAVAACRRLAEKGDAFGQNAMGTMYSLGRGVPLDYLEAVKWFQLAADQGLAGAQNNLGVMYSHGLGVPQNYVLAHLWLSLAAVSLAPGEGRDLAIKNRDRVEKLMTQEQLQEARRLATEWKPQSSQ